MKGLPMLLLLFVGLRADLAGQEQTAGALYMTGQLDSGASSGAGGEVEWLHPISSRDSILLGGASASTGGLWSTYGTVGGLARRDRFVLSARANVGSTQYLDDTFAYVRIIGTATLPLLKQVFVEGEGQHVRVLGTGTTVLRLGGAYASVRGISLRVTYNIMASQTISRHSVSSRADINVHSATIFGGVTAGGSESTVIPALELVTRASREFFGGASFAAGRSRVMCAWQVVPRASGRFSRLTATLQVPVGSSHAQAEEAK